MNKQDMRASARIAAGARGLALSMRFPPYAC